ncbi:MAG: transcriptional repressor LexA [Candidatus Saelkia tenebricola]|nr:transcriptional repressor LexA [Candidatus Saelkia tenebricola]
MKAIKLSERQIRFLSALTLYMRREKRPPTIRELQEIMGLKSPRGVSQYLGVLEEAGYIKRGKGARNIQILKSIPSAEIGRAETVEVPIVGDIACGSPFLAEENIEDYSSVSIKLAKPPYHYFILRTKGNSMDKAGINDGDMVLIRQQPVAESGQDVVALINDEATIKRLNKFEKHISLEPVSSDKNNRRIILEHDFQIQGVVVRTL